MNKELAWKREQSTAITDSVTFDSVTLTGDNALQLTGSATVFDDIRVPLETSVRGPGGGNAPTYSVIGANKPFAFEFSGVQDNTVAFAVQMSHKYKLGSTISPHMHCVFGSDDPSNNIGQTVIFVLEYSWASIDDVIQDTTTLPVTYTISASDAQYKHFIIEFADVVGTGKGLSSMFSAKLTRSGSTDTYASSIHVMEFDIHYEMDTLGSASEYIK